MVKKYTKKKNQKTPSDASQTHDTVAASSSAQPECDESLEAAPWPRDPLTLFENIRLRGRHSIESKKMLKEVSSYSNRDYNAAWSDYHCIHYNGLQRMTFKPTKFIFDYTTKEMEIVKYVKKMWKNMGLGTLGYNPEPIYPDLKPGIVSGSKIPGSSFTGKGRSRITYGG
ncbi:Uncharacterized protein Rs2_47368 [Raphanus sativus]|nr:Uncharacterized protein Rs2_47368 [Raphanus sativus]